MLGTTLGALEGLSLGTSDRTGLGFSVIGQQSTSPKSIEKQLCLQYLLGIQSSVSQNTKRIIRDV